MGTFSILCRWCILYYNGTTLNCWNHWLVCLKVQPPELTRWKRFTCSSDKLSFRAHDRNICLDVQTGCSGFDSYRVRMVERDVLGWWRTAWYDFLWPRCVLRHFSAKLNRHKLLAKEELDPDYQLKESKRNVLMSNVINFVVTDCRGVLKSVNQTVSDPRDVSKSLKAEPRSCQCAPSEVKWRGKHRPFTLHQHQDWGTQYLIISVIQWHPLPAVMSRLCGDDSRVWSLSLSPALSFSHDIFSVFC